jgi:hypothetical protein
VADSATKMEGARNGEQKRARECKTHHCKQETLVEMVAIPVTAAGARQEDLGQ